MLTLFFANALGFLAAHKRAVLIALGVLAVLVLVLVAFKSCSPKPKLDQKEIIQAQQAIETNDRKKMVEVLAASDVREQGIDNSILQAENATEQAKQSYSDKSNSDLALELEKRLNEK